MDSYKLKSPIVLIIFKRPDTTERVFEAIRQARPTKLFVIADGPRADRPGEAEKCAAARAVIDRGHFILDLGEEFRWFQPSKTKIADAWNGAFSWIHKMSKFRMKQP